MEQATLVSIICLSKHTLNYCKRKDDEKRGDL